MLVWGQSQHNSVTLGWQFTRLKSVYGSVYRELYFSQFNNLTSSLYMTQDRITSPYIKWPLLLALISLLVHSKVQNVELILCLRLYSEYS